jgi:hypothetical protein
MIWSEIASLAYFSRLMDGRSASLGAVLARFWRLQR